MKTHEVVLDLFHVQAEVSCNRCSRLQMWRKAKWAHGVRTKFYENSQAASKTQEG